MAWTRPSLETLIARSKGDISSRTEGSAFVKRSFERILAYVLGGLAHGMHGHLDWVRLQILPTTCERTALLAWGTMLDIPVNGAEYATGDADFTGTNTTIIPLGTSAQDAAGNLFTSTAAATITAGTAAVSWIADVAGADGNLESGDPLTLVTPIAGVDSEGTVSADFSSGADLEETEAYRTRVLDGFRVPPSGGGPGDYVAWAKEVSGVTRAWEFGNRVGVGTVSLAFARDDDASIIPDSGEIAAVQAHIEALMPLDVNALYVVAPVAVPVTMTIAISPNTAAVRAAITAELVALFVDDEKVILETALAQSNIDEAISTADGEESHSITTISTLTPGTWGLLTLSTITFTTL